MTMFPIKACNNCLKVTTPQERSETRPWTGLTPKPAAKRGTATRCNNEDCKLELFLGVDLLNLVHVHCP